VNHLGQCFWSLEYSNTSSYDATHATVEDLHISRLLQRQKKPTNQVSTWVTNFAYRLRKSIFSVSFEPTFNSLVFIDLAVHEVCQYWNGMTTFLMSLQVNASNAVEARRTQTFQHTRVGLEVFWENFTVKCVFKTCVSLNWIGSKKKENYSNQKKGGSRHGQTRHRMFECPPYVLVWR